MLLEKDMTPAALLRALTGLLTNREKLTEMSTRARTFAHPKAAARIAEIVASIA